MPSNQLTESGQLRHFLTIEGLKRPLLTEIMDRAEQFSGISHRQVKKVPLLRGKTIINLFLKTVHVPALLSNWLPKDCQLM